MRMVRTGSLVERSRATKERDGVSKKNEKKKDVKLVLVELESQDDVGYLTGQHSSKDEENQVRTPEPRRHPEKGKASSHRDRRK